MHHEHHSRQKSFNSIKNGNKRWPRAASIRSSLVRLGPDHPARARFASENTTARPGFTKRNSANRHLEITFDLFFHFARTIPVSERETAMDLRFIGILGGEEIV